MRWLLFVLVLVACSSDSPPTQAPPDGGPTPPTIAGVWSTVTVVSQVTTWGECFVVLSGPNDALTGAESCLVDSGGSRGVVASVTSGHSDGATVDLLFDGFCLVTGTYSSDGVHDTITGSRSGTGSYFCGGPIILIR